MINGLIQVYQGQLKIGTWDLAQNIGMQHRCLKGILNRYLKKNEYCRGTFYKKIRPTRRKGGQIEEYLMGEYEARLLFALIMDNPKIPMGLNMFILRVPGPEAVYFKRLEEFFDQIKELREFEEI